MRVFEAEIVKQIDKYCIETLGIPSMVLMENAAVSVLNHLDLHINNKFTVVCGVGNNGGDGLAVARHLICRGKEVKIFIVGDILKVTKDFASNKFILENFNQKISIIECEKNLIGLKESILTADIVIDAIFGIGLSRDISGIFEKTIKCINSYSKNILSIDMPSGINSNSGKVMGISISCNKTVTFTCYKNSMIKSRGINEFGEIYIENIGVPDFVLEKFHGGLFMTDFDLVKRLIPKRELAGHKGKFGKISLIAGSIGFTGAAYICAQAAVRTGSGLVTLCTDSYTQNVVSSKAVEFMTCDYYNDLERFKSLLLSCDCVALGPGLGDNSSTLSLLKDVLSLHTKNIVIDADGLNVLKGNLDMLKNVKANIVVTPRVGEMARILACDISYVNENRELCATTLARELGIVVLLKGHNTVITDGNNTYINTTGSSVMASGGMGDCLTGIILSLIGQGLNCMDACIASAYLHGYIADQLSKELYTVQASTIIDNIQSFMKKFQ